VNGSLSFPEIRSEAPRSFAQFVNNPAKNGKTLCVRRLTRETDALELTASRFARRHITNGIEMNGMKVTSARIAEMVLRDERAVIPIGSYNPDYGVTISLPSIVGRNGVAQILDPQMSEEERQALARSAEILRNAVSRMQAYEVVPVV
jgi:hypothetical protein